MVAAQGEIYVRFRAKGKDCGVLYSTWRIRHIIKEYAMEAGIEKWVYPHLFRHQTDLSTRFA
jgi:hypothetical protein